jgi:hypothetical protein
VTASVANPAFSGSVKPVKTEEAGSPCIHQRIPEPEFIVLADRAYNFIFFFNQFL